MPLTAEDPAVTAAANAAFARLSIEKQLTEVYALVDELHEVTDRIKSRVDTVLSTLADEEGVGLDEYTAHMQPDSADRVHQSGATSA